MVHYLNSLKLFLIILLKSARGSFKANEDLIQTTDISHITVTQNGNLRQDFSTLCILFQNYSNCGDKQETKHGCHIGFYAEFMLIDSLRQTSLKLNKELPGGLWLVSWNINCVRSEVTRICGGPLVTTMDHSNHLAMDTWITQVILMQTTKKFENEENDNLDIQYRVLLPQYEVLALNLVCPVPRLCLGPGQTRRRAKTSY